MEEGFHAHIAALRDRIDERLRAYLEAERACPARLREAMAYSLLGPGKRLRPLLTLLACEAVGGSVEGAMAPACAVEMVHAYSLVHDDLPAMDDDDLRRGRPSCHRQFDEATAILVGDGLLTLAFEILARDVRPGELAATCCRELAQASGVAGMVGGQMDDLHADRASDGTLENLVSLHRRKTGALIRAALRLGGHLGTTTAPASDRHTALEALTAYADHLGLAFQIADDLLDVEGHESQTGKKVHKDAARGKLTYPRLLGPAASRDQLQATSQAALAALTPLGERGRWLAAVVEWVARRNN